MAGGIAHDMNNVLGAILALASAGAEAHAPDTRLGRTFETIAKAASRGGEMVKRLLTFTRQSRAEVRELDLNALLREVVRLLERTTLSKVHLELDLAPELAPARGDPSALTHAFINVCINAVDAMPQSGTLTLRSRQAGPDWIEVEVEDTGTGMAKEVLDRALEPFFTTKEQGKGTGLGLSMVYRTIQAHCGQMVLRSEPGQGTRVTLRFPAHAPLPPGPDPVAEGRQDEAGRALNLLAVDDDDLFRGSLQALAETMGHGTTLAASGEAALALLEAGLQPDVVILDMNMPGLGGSGTLPRLRLLRPQLPVLLATGRADQTAMDLVAADPLTTLLGKPFTLEELRSQLGRLAKQTRRP
jgi:CheY-like chemotaxis protein/anti-sigma regulatory factor (Ser/Thr protein kinase)